MHSNTHKMAGMGQTTSRAPLWLCSASCTRALEWCSVSYHLAKAMYIYIYIYICGNVYWHCTAEGRLLERLGQGQRLSSGSLGLMSPLQEMIVPLLEYLLVRGQPRDFTHSRACHAKLLVEFHRPPDSPQLCKLACAGLVSQKMAPLRARVLCGSCLALLGCALLLSKRCLTESCLFSQWCLGDALAVSIDVDGAETQGPSEAHAARVPRWVSRMLLCTLPRGGCRRLLSQVMAMPCRMQTSDLTASHALPRGMA